MGGENSSDFFCRKLWWEKFYYEKLVGVFEGEFKKESKFIRIE